MCLIAYVPSGKSLPLDNIRAAHYANDDGIGIMSRKGVYKFLGKKALRKAVKTVAALEAEKIEYAIHFRYKTHGDVILQNCHPFQTADGRAYVMHNGVLGEYTAKATNAMSDTAVFVSEHLTAVPEDNHLDYWSAVARHIGWNNKLCVMTHDFRFILVHGEAGTYRDGIWYSQTYSLPSDHTSTYTSTGVGGYYRSNWSDMSRRPNYSERSRQWPYHVLDCSCQTCAANTIADARSDNTSTNTSTWYNRAKNRQDAHDKPRIPTSIVTDSLRKALDRRYGNGIKDSRLNGGQRIARQPLRLTHNRTPTPTPMQALAGTLVDTGGDVCLAETQRKEEDAQLDKALHEHLVRTDDDGGYAEVEIEVSTRGDAELPGWSELTTGTME